MQLCRLTHTFLTSKALGLSQKMHDVTYFWFDGSKVPVVWQICQLNLLKQLNREILLADSGHFSRWPKYQYCNKSSKAPRKSRWQKPDSLYFRDTKYWITLNGRGQCRTPSCKLHSKATLVLFQAWWSI